MKNIVVRISDKSGVRLEKIRFSGKTLSIGRAWNSDVILQDKFVDPDHVNLTLEEGGVLLVADLASTNGTIVAGKHLHGEAKAYRLGDTIWVGDTKLNIFDQSAGVEPTSIRSAWFLIADKFKSFPTLFALTLLTVVASVLSDWLFVNEPLDFSDVLMISAGAVLGLVVWSLVFGFISKLIRGESNFRALWVLACLGIILIKLTSFIILILRFNLQNLDLGTLLSTVVFMLLSSWVLVGVFTYTSHIAERYKWLWSLLIVVAIFGFMKSDDFLKKEHEKWSDSSRTEGATLPPAFMWRDSVSIDEYQRETDSLFEFDLAEE